MPCDLQAKISTCAKMVKGGKLFYSVSNDGKWFAHPETPRNEPRNREASTSTGRMLSQVKSSLPQALNRERYTKYKTEQISRVYPFSDHDNKHALKDSIFLFNHGVGLRKCADELRQNNSHFCLSEDAVQRKNLTAYQTEFVVKHAIHAPSNNRRFPHNHKKKCAEAALAHAGEQFMWFGQIK